jgi:alcohol dehydrogenase, propanol-preferring
MGGIYSSSIPPIEHPWISHERVIRSVANSTRRDGRELLRDAALVPVVSAYSGPSRSLIPGQGDH